MILSPLIVGTATVNKYLHYVRDHEAAPSYHLISLLTIFSALIERRLVINRGYTIRGNLYTLLVGPPAARKTYGVRIVREVLRTAGYDIEWLGNDATDEAIIDYMADKEKNGESPAATLVCEEFGTLLGKKKYQEDIAEWLSQLYDGGPARRARKGGTYETEDSFLCVLGATTPDSLTKMSAHILGSGLSSRIMIVSENGKARDTWMPYFDPTERIALSEDFQTILNPLLAESEINFSLGKAANDCFKEWYVGEHARWVRQAPPEMQNWAGRRHDHAAKIAVLLHLIDGGDIDGMGEEAARRGIAFIEAMEPGMETALRRVGRSAWDRKKEWAEMILRRNGGEMGIREFRRGMSEKLEAGESRRMLMDLEEDQIVSIVGGIKVRLRELPPSAPLRTEGASGPASESSAPQPLPHLIPDPEPDAKLLAEREE